MFRNDVGWTQLPQSQKSLEMPQGTPLLHPIVPESWDNWVYKGRGGRQKRYVVSHRQAYWVCGSCVHPTLFLSRRLLNKLFEGYLFSFGATHVFVVFSVVIVVVLIFFQPKSKTVKTKIVRDQKLVENADRVF